MDLWLPRGRKGHGILRELGMDMNTLLYLKWIARTSWIAHGTLLHGMWQPGWEGGVGENRYMYIYIYTGVLQCDVRCAGSGAKFSLLLFS